MIIVCQFINIKASSSMKKERKEDVEFCLIPHEVHDFFLNTVKIRTSALGAYCIFEFFTWALIQSGHLLVAGRLMNKWFKL